MGRIAVLGMPRYHRHPRHRPEVIGAISNETRYANAVQTARPFVEPEVLDDPAIYPNREVIDLLRMAANLPPKVERLRTRAFARFKAGM